MTNATNVATKKEVNAGAKTSTSNVEQKPDLVKELINKAIDIKGKKYVQVSDRVMYFNEVYKNGNIETKLLSEIDNNRVVIKAYVTPDVANPARVFTAYSQEVVGDGMVNKTSALENAETSAVGRALGFMGIGIIEGIASADEVHKAQNNHQAQSHNNYDAPSDKQLELIKKLKEQRGWTSAEIVAELNMGEIKTLTKNDAKRIIDFLLGAPSQLPPVQERIDASDIPFGDEVVGVDVPFIGGGRYE